MTDESSAFDDVFKRDSGSDMGADHAAPVDKGQPRDDSGRFAPREQPAPVAEASATTPDATPPAPETSQGQPETINRHVPLSELLGEREKRKSEATRREEAEKIAADYKRQLDEFTQQMRQVQQPRPVPVQEESPDPWVDPAAALQYQQRQFQQQLMHQNANFSELRARDKFGDEAVDAAIKAAHGANAGQHFMQQRDPYGSLMAWHRQQSFLQKVGTDPDAYEKSIEQRAYERALADLRAGKVPQGQAAPAQGQPAPNVTRFPGSLADATAAGTQGAVLTDEAVAASIFDSRRDRRRM